MSSKKAAGDKGEAASTKLPAPAGTKTRLVRVDQGTIDFMLKHEKHLGRPYPVVIPEDDDRFDAGYRAMHARAAAIVNRLSERELDILHQYRDKGYAEIELTEAEAEAEDEMARKRKRDQALDDDEASN
ncbi:hypothetical protein BS78_08G153600 [Paspalum vaginatum]|nr:hypothetical protein BS78_08G153600 [Paspalum vaginatum]